MGRTKTIERNPRTKSVGERAQEAGSGKRDEKLWEKRESRKSIGDEGIRKEIANIIVEHRT